MARKNKQKRQLIDTNLTISNSLPVTNIDQNPPNTKERKNKKVKSSQIVSHASETPLVALSKPIKVKSKAKTDNSESSPISSLIDSETGNHFSKRRRRETRSSVSEQVSEPQSTSSSAVTSVKSRRHCEPLPQPEGTAATTMASSSSNNLPQKDDMNNDPPKSSLQSTSRGKRNLIPPKSKSKFPQLNLTSTREPSVLMTAPDLSNMPGIVSSGMDVSHFHNYLSSRSLTAPEIGDQINRKLDELRSASNDKTQEYMIMSDINQHLLVSYEDSLNSLRVGDLVTQVVVIIQNCDENLVDLKNICYNVLLHLMEALPRSSDYLVSSLSMFLDKISNLFDFDSLEQIINVIERVSRRHGQAVLQCGAFTIILNYYDFLTAPQQLTILNMISQCFSSLKSTDFSYVINGIENLSNRLKQSEPKCVEKVIQCFVRLVNAFRTDETKLKKLASHNLLANLQDLLVSSPPVVSDTHEIVDMMAVLCANCADLAVDLIRQNISQTILCLCNNAATDCNNRSIPETLALVNLLSELMPPLPPNDNLFVVNRLISSSTTARKARTPKTHYEHVWYWLNAGNKQWISHPQSICHQLEKALDSGEFEVSCQSGDSSIEVNLITMEQSHQFNGSSYVSELKRTLHQTKQPKKSDSRHQMWQDQCLRFQQSSTEVLEVVDLMSQLVPLLMDIYLEASGPQVRYKCLEALARMVCSTGDRVLDAVLSDKAALSSLMASLLSSHDSHILINSLQIGTVLTNKLPARIVLNFKKEGVLYQLDQMLAHWRSKVCTVPPLLLASSPSSSSSSSDRHPQQQHHIDCNDAMDTTPVPASTTATQKFTNWIMKRGCVGRSATTDSGDLQQSTSKHRKHKVEPDHVIETAVKSNPEQTSSSASESTNRRINQIMDLLNMSSVSNATGSRATRVERSDSDNPKKELLFQKWILKYGGKLDSDWRQIGAHAANEKISPAGSFGGPKKDVLSYLKEVVSGLRSENNESVRKALSLYAELLTTNCYISVFEIESSLINEAILEFITKLPRIESDKDKLRMFVEIFSQPSSSGHTESTAVPKKPFLMLVSHLLMCLHQQEQFHVRISKVPAATTSTMESSSSRLNVQSRFALSQVLTDAILGRMSSSRRGVDPSLIDSRLLPSLLFDGPLSRSGNKGTEVNCHFGPYSQDTHPTDADNGFELWNGGEVIGFSAKFNVTLDVLSTVSSIERVVLRELSRHRRMNRRFGMFPKEEMVSVYDSSDSDDDYDDCDGMDESVLSEEVDYQDVEASALPDQHDASLPSQSTSKSGRKKSRNKQKTVQPSNPLLKIREGGFKALRRLKTEPESLVVTPSTSSSCCSSLPAPKSSLKPIVKMQILIGDVVLSPDMTLYQAIRGYSGHVTKLMESYSDGKSDQQIEEAINQAIWKSQHDIHYRPVSSVNEMEPSYRNFYRFGNSDSMSTINFMASLLNPDNQRVVNPHHSAPQSSVNTRQRSSHQKVTHPDTEQPVLEQPVKQKRRRKNTAETLPSIERNTAKSCDIFLSNLTKDLPYPTSADFPSLFEISAPPINHNNSACDMPSQPFKPHYDLSSNMSKKLETTLALLRCLYFINRHANVLGSDLSSPTTIIPEAEFRSQKLSAKANRQLQDTFYVLARNIPFWSVQLFHSCAFLFSLEIRQNFLYLFHFDRARTLLYLEQGASNQDTESLLDSSSEIRRVRVQVNRSERLLEQSELLLKNHSDSRIVLEISFTNEAGFGLGPTNEFYTEVSRCLMRTELNLWYCNSDGAMTSDHVLPPPAGLYPRPIRAKKVEARLRSKFVFLGRFMARALLDGRKIDLPLSPVFYKWLLGREDTIDRADHDLVDPRLTAQLRSLHGLEAAEVLDLGLVFVHPIYPEVELVREGGRRPVATPEDLSLYADLAAGVSLVEGVRGQMEAVLEGFDGVLPGVRRRLAVLFGPHEAEELFCGGRPEDGHCWDVRTLADCCVCDHGYTPSSAAIVNLFEIMAEFDADQRRRFLQFCTGAPRLPVGGFRALRPPFKIVNKREGGAGGPDRYLPSVMTCQNFLKMPDYSSKAVMRQRLLYAIHEGQDAFHLS